MEKNKRRIFPQGLCETCFWHFQCGYAVDNPNEYVRTCYDDGGLSYQEDTQIVKLRKTDLSDTMPVQARIRKPADGGIPFIEIKRAKYKHWHIIGFHAESDLEFRKALRDGTVDWLPKIIEPPQLF